MRSSSSTGTGPTTLGVSGVVSRCIAGRGRDRDRQRVARCSVEQLTAALQAVASSRAAARQPGDDGLGRRPSSRVALVEVGENLGFAAGCNLGFAWRTRPASGDALSQQRHHRRTRRARPTGAAPGLAQRLLRLFADADGYGTDRIWNCGGEIYAVGVRRYHWRTARAARRRAAARSAAVSSPAAACVRTGDFMAAGGSRNASFSAKKISSWRCG